MMGWFKSWDGAASDPKWIVIGKLANAAPGLVGMMAWWMMEHASKATPRGDVSGFDVEGFAIWCGFDPDTCNAVQRCMLQKGFIVNGRIANWEKYQGGGGGGTAMSSTERSRKHRENKKKLAERTPEEIPATDVATDATLHATATPKIRREERERDKRLSLSSPPLPPSGADGPDCQRGGGAAPPGGGNRPEWYGRACAVLGEAAARAWLDGAVIDGEALMVKSACAASLIETRYDWQGLQRALGVSRVAAIALALPSSILLSGMAA